MTRDRALCLQCGRSGAVVGSSLDPNRPLILCRWWEKGHVEHGHGQTLGTFDQAEVDGLLVARREARLQAAHVRGSHDAQANRKCPECQAGLGAKAQVTVDA